MKVKDWGAHHGFKAGKKQGGEIADALTKREVSNKTLPTSAVDVVKSSKERSLQDGDSLRQGGV